MENTNHYMKFNQQYPKKYGLVNRDKTIWDKEVFDWNLFKTAMLNNGIQLYDIGWSKKWSDGIVYFDMWCNDTTGNLYFENFTLDNIMNRSIFSLNNNKTGNHLGYNGYTSLNSYLQEKFAEDYYNNIDWTQSKEFFTNKLVEIVIKGFKETSNRITIKNKKNNIQKRIQNIENDIDNAIINLAEEYKQYDVTFTQEKGITQNISTIYHFKKIFEGYVDLREYSIQIRKDIKGNYDLSWREDDWKFSKMIHFKSNITSQDMINVINGLFEKYLKIPSITTIYNIPDDLIK